LKKNEKSQIKAKLPRNSIQKVVGIYFWTPIYPRKQFLRKKIGCKPPLPGGEQDFSKNANKSRSSKATGMKGVQPDSASQVL
jgi:hypothetical protein